MPRKILLLDVGEDLKMVTSGVTGVTPSNRTRILTNTAGSLRNGWFGSVNPRTYGKLFCRFRIVSAGTVGVHVGLVSENTGTSNRPGTLNDGSVGYYSGNPSSGAGTLFGLRTTTSATRTPVGGYIDLAIDFKAGKVWFGNGTINSNSWFASGNPGDGTAPSFSGFRNALVTSNDLSKPWGALDRQVRIAAVPYGIGSALEILPDLSDCADTCPYGFTPWGNLLKVANEDYIADQSDDEAYRYWQARISKDPDYLRSARVYVWGSESSTEPDISSIEIDNTDGAFDTLLRYDTRDAPVRLRMGYDFEPMSTFINAAAALVDSIEGIDESALRITFRDKSAFLDKPLQPRLYPNSIPAPELEGTPFPFSMGFCRWVPMVNVSPAVLEYALGDSPLAGVIEVRDQGVLITHGSGWDFGALSYNIGVRRLTNPAGKQVASIYGRGRISSTWWDEYFTGTWTSPSPPAGFTIFGTPSATVRFDKVGNAVRCRSDGSTTLQLARGASPSWLYVEIAVANVTAGYLDFMMGSSQQIMKIDRPGVYRASFAATVSNPGIIMRAGVTVDIMISHWQVNTIAVIERLPDWIYQLLAVQSSDYPAADVTAWTGFGSSVNALDGATAYKLGFYDREKATIRDVLLQTMRSFTGWFWFDRLGAFKVGRLVAPSLQPSVLDLNEDDLIGRISVELDTASNLSDGWAGDRNWSPHGESEVAGSMVYGSTPDRLIGTLLQKTFAAVRRTTASLANAYRHATGKEPTETLLTDGAQVQTEGNRVGELFAIPRYFFKFKAFVDDTGTYALEPGQVITIDLQAGVRYNLNGYKKVMILAARSRFLSNVVEFTCWG